MAASKPNNPGLGIEYEVLLPAFFALRLNKNPEIEDFILRSNVREFGHLDDLLVDIKTKSGENLYFAFQLKHKENFNKNLLPTNFEAKSNFNLEKYCEAFKRLSNENRKKYYFILYTNNNFDPARTNEVKKFDMKQDESCLGRNLFDTSREGKHLYKFKVNKETEDGKNVKKEDYREFFLQFSLYTGQANAREAEKSILDILEYKECYATYIDFFRKWHRGDFTNKIIDKKTLNVHLVDILLSSVAIKYHFSDGQDGNLFFFETLVQQFDVTIIDASKQDFIKLSEKKVQQYPEEFNKEEDLIRLAKDNKFIGRFSNELTEDTKLKLLHYFFQKPLILDFNEFSEDVIYKASNLCKIQENGIKLVIVGLRINERKFLHLKIFKNLKAVSGNNLDETKRRCKLSLQGRDTSLEEIFEDEILEFVTPREIFQILKGNFSIGDREKLPEYYIPRTVSATVFDIESIIKHSHESLAIIFYFEGKFDELKILIQNIVDREDYFYEDFLGGLIFRKKGPSKPLHQNNSKDTFPEIPAVILRKEECSRKQFDEIRQVLGKEEHSKEKILKERKDDVHLFQVYDEKRCLLLMSTKNTFFKENYKATKMSVEDNKIHEYFNKSINILCARPGMGKSTFMKYLKNESDPNFWTIMVDLKAHNKFLNQYHNTEEVLKYFLELEKPPNEITEHIREVFSRKKNIAFFLDGLDEVERKCVDRVLEISKQLGETGCRIWLSSRQNLKQTIEQYFNIFSIEMNELSENQQKNYIENRLTSDYNEKQIGEIVDLIFTNTNLANNRQILETPLQLHIITEIFLGDKSYYSDLDKNNFILTKMFKIFFKGKYNHFLAKIKAKNDHFLWGLEEVLENYEIVALHSVLDDEHFQKLQIKKPKFTQHERYDSLGIITEINSENKAVFEHLSFAEYLVSKFLVENLDEARILKEKLFTEKYQNLFLMFNIMLAEDSPLHLAIIYKDLSQIQEETKASPVVDKGGRNFLQVAACVATRHPPLECHIKSPSSACLVKDFPVLHLKGEDSTMEKIISRISLSGELLKNDEIFEWNSLQYALATGALYIVEVILEKSERSEKSESFFNILGKYYSDEVLAYYSIRFGYYRLLSEILAKKSCRVSGIDSDCLKNTRLLFGNGSIFNFLFFTSNRTSETKIVELLTGDDINKAVYDAKKFTFLHFAVIREDAKSIKFLLEKKADPNIKDVNGRSPLFIAVIQNNLEISKLLIENGADANIVDEFGASPLFYAVKGNNFVISKWLVEIGADVNIRDKHKKSPLFYAVQKDNLEISKWLMAEIGVDVNVKDKKGKSPLFYAVEGNNFEISKWLVNNGVDVNITDNKGKSPLFYAYKQDNHEIAEWLVEMGADVKYIKDKKGKSPFP